MQPEGIHVRPRKRSHRLLFLLLIGLLVGFSVWSLWLLVRAQRLRAELDLHFGWIEDVHAVSGELEQLLGRDGPGGEGEPSFLLETFRRGSDDLLRGARDPQVQVAAQSLRLALDELPLPAEAGSPDALWSAAVAALAAAEALESQLRQHVTALHQRLGTHWRSLWLLVVGTLVLAGSNLALLVAIQRRRLESETAHSEVLRQATHDPLTGLWNREGIVRLLGHELNRARRSEAPLGAVLADIEGFGHVNDLLGHDQGDDILRQVARRLQSLVRPYDTMGRFGGDSFLIVLPACDMGATGQIVHRFRAAVGDRDVEHAHGRIRLSLNLAQITVDRAEETDVDTVLRQLRQKIEAEVQDGDST